MLRQDNQKSILVVDPDRNGRASLVEILRGQGFLIVEAESEGEAIWKLLLRAQPLSPKRQFSVVYIHYPLLRFGKSLIKEICRRSEFCQIPVVATSEVDGDQFWNVMRTWGVAGIFCKPLVTGAVRQSLKQAYRR